MDKNVLRNLLVQALAEVDRPDTIQVKAGASLQAVHDSAPEGSSIVLETAFYPGTLLSTKRLSWYAKVVPTGRNAKNLLDFPTIVGGMINSSNGSSFTGVRFTHPDPNATILTDTGTNLTLDRVQVLGDPAKGQHRGILPHGSGMTLVQSWVDNCFLPARDAQAICGWDGTKDLLINDCYLAGGAETVMFGGADSSTPDRVPNGITIMNSTITKDPAWYGMGAQIKNSFELKSARNVVVQDSIIEYAGVGEGQSAYLLGLTVRNQGGKAPWSEITNVLFERCLCRIGGGGVNFLGTDNVNPSGRLSGVTFRNVAFTDLNPVGPWGIKGASRGFLFGSAPDGIVFDGVTMSGTGLSAAMYVLKPGPTRCSFTNVVLSPTKYGIKIDNAGAGWDAFRVVSPDLITNITANDVGAVGYPQI